MAIVRKHSSSSKVKYAKFRGNFCGRNLGGSWSQEASGPVGGEGEKIMTDAPYEYASDNGDRSVGTE